MILREGSIDREADDQGAAAREHAAAIENHGGVHCVLLPPVEASAVCISVAARCTARRMRIWVPQRHRLGSISARICSSVGLEFLRNSACARIIMPAMQ